MLQRWRDTYNKISKINDINYNFQKMKSKQQLYKFGVLSLIERVGGEIEFLAQIQEAQKRGELTAKQAHDLRQAVKRACQEQEGLTVKNGAIDELNRKIAEAVAFYR